MVCSTCTQAVCVTCLSNYVDMFVLFILGCEMKNIIVNLQRKHNRECTVRKNMSTCIYTDGKKRKRMVQNCQDSHARV